MRTPALMAVLLTCVATAPAARAQRVPFDRTVDVSEPATLDVSTIRGKIDVVAGAAGRIVVAGAATVRVGWDVPADAEQIARRVAAAPPIEQAGSTIRLREPADRDAQRAVTVSYRVEVPPTTQVRTTSNSGATSLRGVAASVEVRTQSGAIDLEGLSGAVRVATGSGAIAARDVSGALTVTTGSSSFTGSGIGSSLRARTRSGAIDVTFDGAGDVDVETGSSAIVLRAVRGGLTVKSQSGRITAQGTPTADWVATTASGSVDLELAGGRGFEVDAESRSGSVTIAGATVSGPVTKRSARGQVEGGGPLVRVRTGSGAIGIRRSVRDQGAAVAPGSDIAHRPCGDALSRVSGPNT